MSLNRTDIEWCTHTWNPIVGCLHGCPYCYARKQAKRQKHRCTKCYNFEPHLHPERLADPYERFKPARIFAVDMGDLFGSWVPREWIEQVLKVVRDNPRHTFQLLTKNPKGALGWDFPNNVWLGTSIDRQSRVKAIEPLLETKARIKFISFEPLLEPMNIELNGIRWIIIGGQTRPAFHPPREWVDSLIGQARSFDIPVFLKHNIGWEEAELVREFPDRR